MTRIFHSMARSILIALSISILANTSLTLAAFGVSPPWVENDKLRPGMVYESTIYLSRSDTENAARAILEITGDEQIQEWLTVENADDLVIPVGANTFPMNVVVQVPEEATVGNYKGGIMVKLAPISEQSLSGGQVAITLGANISVDLTITDQEITDYRVQSAQTPPQDPKESFEVSVEVANTGNTELSSIEGEIEIYDRSNSEVIQTLPFQPFKEPVAFNETKEVKMTYDEFQPEEGEYWVQIKAVQGGETVYENKLLQRVGAGAQPIVVTPEDVLGEPATVIKPPVVATPTISKTDKNYIILGMAGLVVGLFALLFAVALLYKKSLFKKTKRTRRTKR